MRQVSWEEKKRNGLNKSLFDACENSEKGVDVKKEYSPPKTQYCVNPAYMSCAIQ